MFESSGNLLKLCIVISSKPVKCSFFNVFDSLLNQIIFFNKFTLKLTAQFCCSIATAIKVNILGILLFFIQKCVSFSRNSL